MVKNQCITEDQYFDAWGKDSLLHTSGFPIKPTIKERLENLPLSSSGIRVPFRQFCPSGKEEARTGRNNLRTPKSITETIA